ncbi:unnamed protein product [Adineta steineri]|uniref:Ferric-chelate reductase 1 n=1 Tax=Adineta steineri TaxID=433720 RepID=A0A814XWV3_9BILA|nr:unnamed protein product [Adineta steineri]CAF3820227.1 unnamed protein product [Adineta steineri]
MKSSIYRLFFFFTIFIKHGYNYPTGAPDTICGTMTPGHGVSSQTCSSKYTLKSDKSQYGTSDVIHITVNGSTSTDVFEGVLLVAKTQTSGQVIGTWVVVSSTTRVVNCDGIANTGITHISNDNKLSVEALWYPPATITDPNTIIKATIVTAFTTIYVNCFSITLNPKQANISSNGTTLLASNITTISSSTIISPTTTTPIVSQTSDVGVNINWTYTNGLTSVKMQINNLKTSQWLALGLSLDQQMGEDHVFVCKHLSDNTVALERRINPGGHTPPVLASTIANPGGTLNIITQKLENGIAYCEFTLSNFTSSTRRKRAISVLSQSTPYYPLIAIGNLDSSNQMMQHTSETALSQNVQLNQQTKVVYNIDGSGDSAQSNLMKAHGIIMIFTWILFVSTGIILARYFKQTWPNKKLCGHPIWFAVHRALMPCTALLTIIAFILILVYEKGKWIEKDEQPEFAHSIVGILVICFVIIQPIMALFRCKPDAHYRFIFNYLHRFVGISALILSIVAMFLAMFFTQFNFRATKVWGILVAWSCWLPIIFIIFWFIDFHYKQETTELRKADSYDMNDVQRNGPVQINTVDVINNTKKDRIKGIFLLIHIMVALGLALALAIVVGKA